MSKASPRIMILYASYGSGHLQAAHAIEAELRQRGMNDIVLLDLMAEAYPLLYEINKFVYKQCFKLAPQIYGWIYDKTKHMQPDSSLATLLHGLGSAKLKKYLFHEQPDLIIHTFPQAAASLLVRRATDSPRMVTIITDFDLHGRWLHAGVDRYYVATDDLKNEAVKRGICPEQVIASGIPLLPLFESLADKEQSGLPKGLVLNPNRKSVLLMGGVYGAMKNYGDICRQLSLESDLELIVVCGRNDALYRKLSFLFKDHPYVHVLGYVNQICGLMKHSSCMITKPGGITLSECIACKLPLFLYSPAPGQEQGNAQYLKAKGAAVVSYQPEELSRQVCDLIRDQGAVNGLRERITSLHKPQAAKTIVDDLLENILDVNTELLGV
ncbi:MGDG synthase family glycosyltransferase [Paenibacillus faecalis]|uniref:MGDG synthase family glycosyltransferase n=1 Tax=Paenibacillus faecalis TaxID=2079532 RepID=UPI000D0E7FFC|nr:glycosyltransferase [Paenibacillus faecalis]